MLAYFLKINVAIALFYAFYRLFFYKDTFFTWRRTALLCFFAISAVYPLLNIQTWITEQEPMVAMADLYADIVLPEFTITPEQATSDWKSLLLQTVGFAYWGMVIVLAIRFFIQLAGIIRLAFRCRKAKIGNTNVHLLRQASGPFSFFHWIFIHPTSHTEDELSEILTHEQTHANQWHSIDVLVSEIVCIFCWFNPFAWLMKREIRTNLEYLADNRVLETGHDSKAYQYHLLGLSHHKAAATIYNSFNVLPLKKRIKMMNKQIRRMIDEIFADMKMTADNLALRDELMANAQARFEDSVRAGKTEEEAFAEVAASLGDVQSLLREMNAEKPEDSAEETAQTETQTQSDETAEGKKAGADEPDFEVKTEKTPDIGEALGKAFGGAVGGFTTGRREIIDMLRQRSRPYLFSNSLPPAVVGAGIELFKILGQSNELHDRLVANVEHFRAGMMAAGFDIKPTQSAICAVMLYDAKLSQDFAARLQEEGVFVTGFYYPVVPKGQARIRVQVSAGHTVEQLDRCIAAFVKVGRELNVLQ